MKSYDKNSMEIVEEEETDDQEKKGKIAQIEERGWEAEGKIIKKTKVTVYK